MHRVSSQRLGIPEQRGTDDRLHGKATFYPENKLIRDGMGSS